MKSLIIICWTTLIFLWPTIADMPSLIETEYCKVPYYNIKFTDIPTGPVCGKRRISIIKVGYNQIKFVMRKKFHVCCYQDMEEAWQSVKTKRFCKRFKNNTIINLEHGLIRIKCYDPEYQDNFMLIKDKSYERIWPAPKANRSWNVLLLGIEAISRLRAYNSLPLTTHFLNANQWLDFPGYNTVGNNEDTNSAILLGSKHNWATTEPKCKVDISLCKHMLIWHEFARRGYVTAFGEDAAPMHNKFHRWNFTHPADHYFRPTIIKQKHRVQKIICDKQIPKADQMLNYILDFTKTYNEKHNFIGYFRLSSYSQNIGPTPKAIDRSLSTFLKKLKDSGIWNTTIVILFSDSGYKFVPARHGLQYFYDERLPMLFIGLPEEFKEIYPEQYLNILTNQRRFVSPFDVHLALWDILKMGQDFLEVPDILGCSQCHSLFKIVSEYRTCSEAGIRDTWCLCSRLALGKFS